MGTANTRVLIDAGISGMQTIERLAEIGVSLDTIQAILITHEHSDHIKGLSVIAERLKVPVLANSETAKGIYSVLGYRPRFKIFTTGETFEFGDLKVHPFSIPHDTLDPVAFTMETGSLKIGFCTDIGHATSLVKKQLEKCDYLYVEANHEPSMVYSSSRPEMLKQRILGKQGHLSNEDCGKLIGSVWHDGLKHVHLAHLSKECNTKEVALAVVARTLEAQGIKVDLSIAFQEEISRSILF